MRRSRGHIQEKEKGKRYVVVVSQPVDPRTGRNRQKWVTVRGTRQDAEKKLTDLLHKIDTDTLPNPSKTTVGTYLERWLSDYATPNLSPRTVEGYRTIVKNHLVPTLGNIGLQKLTTARVAQYYREMLQHGRHDGRGGLSSTTVRQHAMVLHKAFETAIQWGLLSRNPADKVQLPRQTRPEWHPFDDEDIRRLLKACSEHRLYPLFQFAIGTGMRRSEIMGLRWCDIDLDRCAAYVTRSLHQLHNKEYVVRPPKTNAGKRTVMLTPDVVQMLRRYRAHREAHAIVMEVPFDEQSLVFCNDDGSHIRPDYVSAVWRKYAKKVGIAGVRFHDARHFHATMLLKQNVHPKVVQARLGHSTISVTLDTYSHLLQGMQAEAIKDFDQLVFSERDANGASQRY
ncbi:MAG: site-specific integrase [Dehalococcoidia bacterium]|nr:site-specific integrase [Dehalococcoidia bacterium]